MIELTMRYKKGKEKSKSRHGDPSLKKLMSIDLIWWSSDSDLLLG